jgi:hypothetical protein
VASGLNAPELDELRKALAFGGENVLGLSNQALPALLGFLAFLGLAGLLYRAARASAGGR